MPWILEVRESVGVTIDTNEFKYVFSPALSTNVLLFKPKQGRKFEGRQLLSAKLSDNGTWKVLRERHNLIR